MIGIIKELVDDIKKNNLQFMRIFDSRNVYLVWLDPNKGLQQLPLFSNARSYVLSNLINSSKTVWFTFLGKSYSYSSHKYEDTTFIVDCSKNGADLFTKVFNGSVLLDGRIIFEGMLTNIDVIIDDLFQKEEKDSTKLLFSLRGIYNAE